MTKKIAFTVDQQTVTDRERRVRLAREAAKLDATEEKAIAEEGLDALASLDSDIAAVRFKPLAQCVRERGL